MQATLSLNIDWFYGRTKRIFEKRRRPHRAAALVILITFSCLLEYSARPVAAEAASGRVIDLYTEKTPFDGRGANESSDAFEPQELVVLSALVTYNDAPVAQKAVAFQIKGPPNPILNITIIGSASSDQDGIAEFSFRIPWPSNSPEEQVFGTWFAIATVSIADQTVIDTLTFRVGWIIRIAQLTTLNALEEPTTRFLRKQGILFNLTVENIALTEKVATIVIDVQDVAGNPIIHLQRENLVFQPGITCLIASAQILTIAKIGPASVLAGAYKALPENRGVLYSPAVSATFEIITRDISVVAVRPSRSAVISGQTLNITVTVKNKGNETESFNVTAYYDSTPVGKRLVAYLAPQAETSIVFEWNTTGLTHGSYVISGAADVVEGEIETEDNTLVDGTVTIFGYPMPSVIPSWRMLLFLFVVALLASLVLLLFLGYLWRRRRRKVMSSLFTVIAHPHI
jgi:hypothetical protein